MFGGQIAAPVLQANPEPRTQKPNPEPNLNTKRSSENGEA
jgi:hypothetical protein